jgi:coproporphyrinogen III oxidase
MKQVPSFKEPFLRFIHRLQDEICQALLAEDDMATLTEDNWTREEGGGGKTRVIAHGNVFEKGGVNTSAVHGKLPPAMMSYLRPDTAISLPVEFHWSFTRLIRLYPPFMPTTAISNCMTTITNSRQLVWWRVGPYPLLPL